MSHNIGTQRYNTWQLIPIDTFLCVLYVLLCFFFIIIKCQLKNHIGSVYYWDISRWDTLFWIVITLCYYESKVDTTVISNWPEMKLNSALKHQDFTNAEKWMINGHWLWKKIMSKMKLQNNLLPLLFSRIVYMINSMDPLVLTQSNVRDWWQLWNIDVIKMTINSEVSKIHKMMTFSLGDCIPTATLKFG